MFDYFYNEIFRSVIIAFGTLFNNIEVRHNNDNDDTWSRIKVPLAYGPTQKFLARLEQSADLNKPVQITLPRMSFEFTNLTYDPSRKLTQTQQVVVETPEGKQKKYYLPVPYNMTIQLSIMTKLNDDMLQIIEQILPYFQPYYNLPVKFLGEIKEVKDIPVQLDNIDMIDDYEGNFDTRRAMIYTLTFTAKTYLYGPVTDSSAEIIKKVSVGYWAGAKRTGIAATTTAERDVVYSVTPRALKDYDGVVVTNVAENTDMSATFIVVEDASNLTAKTYIYIDMESLYIKSISGNKVFVKRGQDGTTISNHVQGAAVYNINDADDALVEPDDDFGFSGEYTK